MRLATFAAVAVTAAVLATAVGAAPTPLSPAPGASTTSTHPTFRWTIAPPEVSDSITIASSPTLAATGEFVTANLVDEDDLASDATSWSPTRPLPAGTYFWHIGSVDTTPGAPRGDLYSPVTKLTIKPAVSVQSLKLVWTAGELGGLLYLRTNASSVDLGAQLFNGRHLLGSHRATTSNNSLDQPSLQQFVLTFPATVKRGTKLRLVVTLTIRGTTAKASLVKIVRAP